MVTVKNILQKSGELGAMLIVMDTHIQSIRNDTLMEGWQARLEEIDELLQRHLDEIPDFGEAFDSQ